MYAIVPAAGESLRMRSAEANTLPAEGSASSKLFIPIFSSQTVGSVTILELSLRSLVASGIVQNLILVARPEDFSAASEIIERVKFPGETKIIAGGKSRQESVWHGLKALPENEEFVMVHDGARPMCEPQLIRSVTEEGIKTGSAILAVPVRSTLKRASSKNTVVKSVSRDNLWAAQTPQVFQTKLLITAHEKAQMDEFMGTDDSELIEHVGREVTLVLGSQLNIKVTTPEDLHLIKAILRSGDPSLYPHFREFFGQICG